MLSSVVFVCALAAFSQDSNPPSVRTAGSAERRVAPDLAQVSVQVFAEGPTPAEAGRRLAARVDSLRRALTTLGIPRDSMVNRSRWYWWPGRIEPVPLPMRYEQRDTGTRRFSVAIQDTVYRARETIEVRIRDLSKVGAALDTAMGRGITGISPVQFSAADVAAAQEDALREATARARRQAEAIAQASGMTLGAVISLSTLADARHEYEPSIGLTAVSLDGGNQATVVVPPTIPVSVTVYGRWALVKKSERD